MSKKGQNSRLMSQCTIVPLYVESYNSQVSLRHWIQNSPLLAVSG